MAIICDRYYTDTLVPTSKTIAKISTANTGKSKPKHVIDAMVAGKKKVGGYDNNSGKKWYNDGLSHI